jgi:hypothetical protein
VSSLTALTTLYLKGSGKVTDEGLQTLSSLSALTTLNLRSCGRVTAAAKQALRTVPNLTIVDHHNDEGSLTTHSCCHPAPQCTSCSAPVYNASRGGPPSLAV